MVPYTPLVFLHVGVGIDFIKKISRAAFQHLCKDLFISTLPLIDKALKDSLLSKPQIHEIILSGGSIQIPYLQLMFH